MKKAFLAVIIISVLTILTSLSFAVPVEISYQGYLTDAGGVPVDGTRGITFRLYDHETETQPINLKWESDPIAVTISNGIYSVILGELTSIDPAIFSTQLWLGIEIESEGEMVTRQKLTSVAYSLNAQTAQTAESVSWSAVSDKPDDFNDSIDNDTLGSLSCTTDQIAKWNGSAWVCADNTPQGSAPSAPTNVQAIGGDGQITISWSPVAGATSYNIYWNTTGGVTTSDSAIISAPSPYVHMNLPVSNTYYYAITSINANGESGLSTEVSAVATLYSQMIQKLTASDAQADDYFGFSVSINGDYAIVGAYGEDGGGGDPLSTAGAAYIFHRTGANTWDAGTKIVAPDAQADDDFGRSVSINGDYAIVGALREDGGAADPLNNTGAVYIFHRTGITWDTGTKLVAPDSQAGDFFGSSVSISGDYAIVGADGEDGGSGDPLFEAGAAYIFHRTGPNTWNGGTKVIAPDAQADDWFGYSVSISGDYAIVGALFENGGPGDPMIGAGGAYIFQRTGTNTWDTGTKIVAPDVQAGDSFGMSVSISGDYAIVGAYGEDGGAGDPLFWAGAAYVFHRTGTNTWDGGTKIIAPDAQAGDSFGSSVSISGDYAIVGADQEDGGGGDPLSTAGAAYIFRKTGTNSWDAGTKLIAPDAQAVDLFGNSVSISGDHAIVGAYGEDGGGGDPLSTAGAVYIY